MKLHILRNGADYRTGEDLAVAAHLYVIVYSYMGAYLAAVSYFHILRNIAERPYFHIGADFGIGMYIRVVLHLILCF